MQLRFHPAAQAEFAEAVTFYSAESERRAARFFGAVEDLLAQALVFPRAAQGIFNLGGQTVRAYRVSKFPYYLLAVADDDMLMVIAVAHHRRKPGYWLDRLEP